MPTVGASAAVASIRHARSQVYGNVTRTGDAQSAPQDSFADLQQGGLLDCSHYTRPEVYEGLAVPPVLMSGHHAHIVRWRREQSLRNTLQKRPDLIERARREGRLSKQDEKFLSGLESGPKVF